MVAVPPQRSNNEMSAVFRAPGQEFGSLSLGRPQDRKHPDLIVPESGAAVMGEFPVGLPRLRLQPDQELNSLRPQSGNFAHQPKNPFQESAPVNPAHLDGNGFTSSLNDFAQHPDNIEDLMPSGSVSLQDIEASEPLVRSLRVNWGLGNIFSPTPDDV